MKKWKQFERIVTAIHHAESDGGIVKWDDIIDGRQFDVTIKFKHTNYSFLIVVECKDYKGKVPLEKVEAFATKSKSVKANKSVIVSSKGFQSGCFKCAKQNNIELFTVEEFSNIEEKFQIRQFIPHLNYEKIGLIDDDSNKIFWLSTNNSKLFYQCEKTIIWTARHQFTINDLLNKHYHSILNSSSPEQNDFFIELGTSHCVNVPFHDTMISSKIVITHSIRTVAFIDAPPADPSLLDYHSSYYRYKNEATGESTHYPCGKIHLGFDTKFDKGNFYKNSMGFYYYVYDITPESVKLILLESYQHGTLVQARFSVNHGASKHYLPVTNEEKLSYLKRILEKYKKHMSD